MGFVAAEQVEVVTYDFNPFVDVKGTVPEPTTKQIETFRQTMFAVVQGLGLDPKQLASGEIDFSQVDELLAKSGEAEQAVLDGVADLTGIANATLNALPYRVKAAFMGYIVGVFLNPEA